MTEVINLNNYTIVVNSIGGHGTSLYIKELKIAFDMGLIIDHWVHNTDNVFISHGLCDHVGALHFHARLRRLYKIDKPPNYFLPNYCHENFNNLYKAIAAMDKGLSQPTPFNYNKIQYNICSSDNLT